MPKLGLSEKIHLRAELFEILVRMQIEQFGFSPMQRYQAVGVITPEMKIFSEGLRTSADQVSQLLKLKLEALLRRSLNIQEYQFILEYLLIGLDRSFCQDSILTAENWLVVEEFIQEDSICSRLADELLALIDLLALDLIWIVFRFTLKKKGKIEEKFELFTEYLIRLYRGVCRYLARDFKKDQDKKIATFVWGRVARPVTFSVDEVFWRGVEDFELMIPGTELRLVNRLADDKLTPEEQVLVSDFRDSFLAELEVICQRVETGEIKLRGKARVYFRQIIEAFLRGSNPGAFHRDPDFLEVFSSSGDAKMAWSQVVRVLRTNLSSQWRSTF